MAHQHHRWIKVEHKKSNQKKKQQHIQMNTYICWLALLALYLFYFHLFSRIHTFVCDVVICRSRLVSMYGNLLMFFLVFSLNHFFFRSVIFCWFLHFSWQLRWLIVFSVCFFACKKIRNEQRKGFCFHCWFLTSFFVARVLQSSHNFLRYLLNYQNIWLLQSENCVFDMLTMRNSIN